MFSCALSAVINGIESKVVQVQADVSTGLPFFELVGYLSGEVKEARERVRTAIRNSGFELEPRKIIVNLSPADTRKSGTCFDLAIACAILSAYGKIPPESLKDTMIAGELGLDGRIDPVNGVLPIVLMAREMGLKRCLVPAENAFEGASIREIKVYGVAALQDAADFLKGKLELIPADDTEKWNAMTSDIGSDSRAGAASGMPDFADIRGQGLLRRSMEVAAAGLHNLLIIGPPGSGKSMAARRLPSILPSMSYDEVLEVSRIYSVSGLLDPQAGLIKVRPFRSPHHTISAPALAGGGKIPVPGEISLAHKGVLFLDELTEFNTDALESLREPLENGRISISRVQASCTFPARFMLVAAMNPCSCGYYPDASRCHCTPLQIRRFIGRISRPLLDRIDMTVEVKHVNIDLLQGKTARPPENSETIRERVSGACDIQRTRFSHCPYEHNSEIPDNDLKRFCHLGEEEMTFMKKAYNRYSLTARGYGKLLRVARTIADLDQSDEISCKHLAEAVFFKSLDRQYWERMNS